MPPRQIPRHVPKLVPTRVTTATTYHFKNAARDFGWALATVNDETGELHIKSDWGSWSYRWDARPSNLGAPTLSHFLANRSECDYLADKLWGGGYGGSRFSPEKTVAYLRTQLAKTRLEQGREYLATARDLELSTTGRIDLLDAGACHRIAEVRRYWNDITLGDEPLSRGIARQIWDALDDLVDVRSADLFIERLHNVNGHSWLGEELWNDTQTEQDPMYQVLLLGILPALVEAIRARLNPTSSAPSIVEAR